MFLLSGRSPFRKGRILGVGSGIGCYGGCGLRTTVRPNSAGWNSPQGVTAQTVAMLGNRWLLEAVVKVPRSVVLLPGVRPMAPLFLGTIAIGKR